MSSPRKKKPIHAIKAPVEQYPDQKLIRMLALVIAAVAIVQYIQTLWYDFALDDYSAIIENKITQGGIKAIPVIFQTTYRFGYPIQGDELYRPIPKSIYAIMWQLFHKNAFPLHLLNVGLYALTGYLLFITLLKFFPRNIYLPFIATLLFIAHPVHSEVVANIKSMDEILSFLFFVISLFYLQKFISLRVNRWIFLALLSYFASLLSKESAITFLAIYPLFLFFFTEKNVTGNLRTCLWFLIPAIIFLLIRYKVVGETVAPTMADNVLMGTKDEIVRKATAVYILGLYLYKLFLPLNLAFDYSYKQIQLVGIGDWRFLLSALIYVLLLVFALLRFRKKDPVAFGILFYLVTISLSSNLFIYIGTHMAERLLYLPSFGFCFALAAWANRFIEQKSAPLVQSVKSFFANQGVLATVMVVVVLLCSVKVWSQNPVWKNNESLYESGIIASPESHRTHYYLGNYLVKKEYYSKFPAAEQQQIIQRGLSELRKATSIYPGIGDAWLNIGNYFTDVNQPDSAAFYFRRTIKVQPYLATAHNNLGTVYFNQNKFDSAIIEFKEAVRLNGDYTDAYRNLGSAYATVGRFQESIPYFQRSIQTAPNDADGYYYLGITYQNLGNAEEAKVYLERAAALDAKYRK